MRQNTINYAQKQHLQIIKDRIFPFIDSSLEKPRPYHPDQSIDIVS